MHFSHSIQLFETNSKLVEQFLDAIIAVDASFTITFWNYGATLLLGYERSDMVGNGLDLLQLTTHTSAEDLFRPSPDLIGSEWRGEGFFKRKNGTLVECLISVSRITDTSGSRGFLIIARDISEKKEMEHLLQKLNAQLAAQTSSVSKPESLLFDRINDGLILFDTHWNYTHINKAGARMVGREAADLVGKNVWKEFPKSAETNFYKLYHQAMETQQYNQVEEYSVYLDKWFEVDMYPSREGLAVFFHDITDKKRTEKLLSEREMLYRNIVETAQEGVWMVDVDGKTTFVNPWVATVLGYDREYFIGRLPFEFMDEESAARAVNDLASLRHEQSMQPEYTLVTRQGQMLWVLVHATPIFHNTVYSGALGMIVDITDRKRKESELKESFEQLRLLTSKLQTVREEERSAIAREIHDELGQQLTALKMDAFWLAKNLSLTDVASKRKLQSIINISTKALNAVEKKSFELHPGILHNFGLLAAIDWQNHEFQQRYDITIDFNADGNDQHLPDNTPIAFYRIYQEALHNIARHALATKIVSRYKKDDRMISLTIEDNGRGFDPANLHNKKSLGILSMRERAGNIGADFQVSSAIGRGTRIAITITLHP